MHDRHQVHVLMAIQMKGDVSAAELPEAGNLRLNLFVELTGDAPSPRVYGR